jgi:hypothetical protein
MENQIYSLHPPGLALFSGGALGYKEIPGKLIVLQIY